MPALDFRYPSWVRVDEHVAGEIMLLVLREMEQTLRRSLTPEEAQQGWVQGWRIVGAAGLHPPYPDPN